LKGGEFGKGLFRLLLNNIYRMSNTQIGIQFSDISGSVRLFVSYCLRRWYLFLLVGVLGGLAGIVYAWLSKPKYTANVLFALEDNGGGLSGALSLAAEFGLNLGGGNDVYAGENILIIITSRSMVEKVLLLPDTVNGKVQTFAQTYAELYKMTKAFQDHPRLKGVQFPLGVPRQKYTYQQDSALFLISKSIIKGQLQAIRPDRKLNIYAVSMMANNERFAKVFVERLLQETINEYTEMRSSRARETLAILEERVATIKGGMNAAIDSRAAVQDANVNPAFAAAQAPLQRRQFEISSYGQAYAELFKNLELARFQYLKSIPLLKIIEPARYPLEFKKPGRLRTGVLGGMLAGMLLLIYMLFGPFHRFLKVSDPLPNP
jgi:hypothetical protein